MSSTYPPPETFSYPSPALISDGPRRLNYVFGGGKSREFEVISVNAREAAEHYARPYSRFIQDPSVRFQTCYSEWKEAVKFLSDINEICTDFAYLRIIGMGPAALPLIFKELRREPDHWFWALKAITNKDPVPEDHRGRMKLMAEDWLRWAEQNGFAR